MWKQKVSVSVGNSYVLPTEEVIAMVGKIGFEVISLACSNGADIDKLTQVARDCGLTVQSLHAPILNAANMWSHDDAVGLPARQELLSVLDTCKRNGIPIMVAHVWIGFRYTFDAENLNFANYDAVVAYAKQCGVKIAFENTEGEEYLFALMERYKGDDTVGFCWDSGHEMCYNRSRELLTDFGDRLLMTHLNDNLGIRSFEGNMTSRDDLHLLPGDGNIHWESNIRRLKDLPRQKILNFELKKLCKSTDPSDRIYADLSTQDYFNLAAQRARQIADLYEKELL